MNNLEKVLNPKIAEKICKVASGTAAKRLYEITSKAVYTLFVMWLGLLIAKSTAVPLPAAPLVPTTAYVNIMLVGQMVSYENICADSSEECDDIEIPEVIAYRMSTASGVKFDKDRILTAGHVCDAYEFASKKIGSKDEDGDVLIGIDFTATDFRGDAHDIRIMAIDHQHDLCVVSVEVYNSEIAKVSDKKPFITERVWNVSAPQGIFTPGAPIVLDGVYTGELHDPFGDQYTIPGAPGSSGSPVFRSNGELIGIIHSVNPRFEHATYSATLSSIKQIIKKTEE